MSASAAAAAPAELAAAGVNVARIEAVLAELGARDDEMKVLSLAPEKAMAHLAALQTEAEAVKAVLNPSSSSSSSSSGAGTVHPALDGKPAVEELLRGLMEDMTVKMEALQVAVGQDGGGDEKKPEFLVPEEESGPPEIAAEELEYNEAKDFLGQGSFGKVYNARCRGKQVAVKVPLKQDLSDKELEEFKSEVKIMKKIFHPNCVLFLGACSVRGNLKIVTELLYTDMEKLLKSRQVLPLYQRMKMARDAAVGMNWLHGIVKVVHHDLKPANLLVDENLVVKITDYGFSQLKEHAMGEDGTMQSSGLAKGTPLWMAPEIMTGRPFTEKCDVYAFGIILWQILTRKEPFQHHSDFRKFRLAVCKRHERPPLPDDCPRSLSALIQRCWAADYEDRPDFNDITVSLEHQVLETLVPNEAIRGFWAQHFLLPKKELQEIVPWSEFVQRLYLALNPAAGAVDAQGQPMKPIEFHRDTFNKLKDILAVKNIQDKFVVNVRRFASLCTWFGHFFRQGMDGYRVLDEIRIVVDKPWFHGEITKEEAEQRLFQQPEGTFLVRVSESTPEYPFTISMTGNQHRRVHHPPNGTYSFKGHRTTYATLHEIVERCEEPKIAAQMQTACSKETVDSSGWGYA